MFCKQVVAFVVFIFSIPVAMAGAQPWDQPFSPDPAALLKAAKGIEVPADQPIDILLEDHRYTVTTTGRLQQTYRKVYRIVRQDSVDEWSSVERKYQPWREAKPSLRARVLTSDGVVHNLDPKTISDAPAAESEESVFSDARVLRAPLPAVAAGAIVEYELTMDIGPAFAEGGVGDRVSALDFVPLEHLHVAIDAPKGIQLSVAVRGIPGNALQRSSPKGATRVELDLPPMKARKEFETNLPFDVPAYGYLAFTTAPSWQGIARRYSSIVDTQIEAADVKAFMGTIDPNAPPEALVAALVSQLHRNIRYTGVEFGEAAVVPARPGEVLARKYGDCKDKSALLVAMLRKAGLKAFVALLNAGYGVDTNPEIPGTEWFDHAIVYIDLPGKPMWVDATANDYHSGDLPEADQGRQALIASPATTALTTVPEQSGKWERRTYDIRFKDYGRANITEIMEGTGSTEARLRQQYISNSNLKDSLEKYVKSAYQAKSLGHYELEGSDDLNSTVRVSFEAVETPQAVTTAETAEVRLDSTGVLKTIPWNLRNQAEEDEKTAASKRSADFVFPLAGTTEHAYHLRPPVLFKVGKLPESNEVKLGPLVYSRKFQAAGNGIVDVTYKLVVPQRRLTATEYEAMREALKRMEAQTGDVITFVPETAEYLAIGQAGKAISLLRKDVSAHPADATARIRFSRLLVTCGLGSAARAEAKKATELDPQSTNAWQALAWTWQNDSFGHLRRGDWNRDEAVKYQRKALEVDPDDFLAKLDLAILLEFDSHGVRYGDRDGVKEAIGLYRETQKKQFNAVIQTNLTASLFYSGQYAEAATEAAKSSEPQRTVVLAATGALRDGPAKAIVALQASVPEPTARVQMLAAVTLMLMHARRYEEAHVLLQAAARISTDPQVAAFDQLLSRAKRQEDIALDPADPESPVQQFVFQILAGQLSREKVKPLLTADANMEGFEEAASDIRSSLAATEQQMSRIGLTMQNVADISAVMIKAEKEGDEQHGYRVSMQAGSSKDMVLFVVREGGAYKILGGYDDAGKRALQLLKQKDIEGAQWWLDKSAKVVTAGANGWMPAAHSIWSGLKPETRGPDTIRAAAAALIGAGTKSDEAVQILEATLAKPRPEMDKAEIQAALCETFSHSKQWDQLLKYGNQLKASKTFHDEGLLYVEEAAAGLSDWKTLESAALEHAKDDNRRWRQVVLARIRMKNAASVEEALEKMKPASGPGEVEEFRAWNAIFQKKVTADSLATLTKVDGGGLSNMQHLNYYLIALVDALLQKPDDAMDALKKAVGDSDVSNIDARAWVVYSLICQEYGFEDAALSAKERARSAKAENDDAKLALATLQ